MKRLLLLTACAAAAACSADWRDASLPPQKRAELLTAEMTLDEKIGQLTSPYGWEMYERQGDSVRLTDTFREAVQNGHIGMLWGTFRADPWTQKDLRTGLTPQLAARLANRMQRYAVQHSRLGIPLFLAEEAPHGHMAIGATTFPTAPGQASTWNPELIERMGKVIAAEIRLQGGHICYGPVLDIVRDPRWSRTEESYGEDRYLTARIGEAYVRGTGSGDLSQPRHALSTLKHFIAYGASEGGQNGGSNLLGERELRETYLPPFEAAVKAGARSVMTAYNSMDGIPCTANRRMLTDILRGEWGFKGFFVSDWMDVERLEDYHRICDSQIEAFRLAVDAGLDFHMHGPDFYFGMIELVRSGRISEKRVDEAVRKVLSAKFRLGLFENPYVDVEAAQGTLFNDAHKLTALEAARQGIVLLKNEGGLLPIDTKRYRRILVTGPNADNQSILGDWSADQPAGNVVTIRRGLEQVRSDVQYTFCGFSRDFDLKHMRQEEVDRAVRAARGNDLAIVVVGENSMRYHWNLKTCGENTDRYDLTLAGLQQQLVERIAAQGIPVVVVLVNGRPLTTEWIADNIPAVVEAWEPGSLGGRAVAEILFGEVNPSAKMPITVPRHSGQIQCYYNYRFTSKWFPYATGNSSPLYEFGYGLSYTTFAYGEPRVDRTETGRDGTVNLSVEVTNTGSRAGDEIVQLYVTDDRSSATRPVKELKDFARISLEPGQTKTVTFAVTPDKLAFYDAAMNYGVEPGTFTLRVGSSSRDRDLQSIGITVR